MKLTSASIAGVTIVIGAGILAGPRVVAWAQTLAGTAAAGAAGASLGAAAGTGMLTPSQYAKKATDAGKKTNAAAKKAMAGGNAKQPNIPNPSTASASQKSTSAVQPERWGTDNGQQMLNQLTRHSHTNYSPRKVEKRHRSHNVLAKYIKPPRGWLGYYLPQDRYKVTSHVWRFTTTPNDKFYYEPWVLTTKHRPAGQVIGFHSWQDAMIAGYRPDPVSLPEPGRQLAILATYSQGDMMQKFIEFTYAGQITPIVFAEDYKYVMSVAHAVQSSRDWSYLLRPTVDQAIGSTLGLASPPTQVGITVVQEKKNAQESAGASGMPGGAAPPGASPPAGAPAASPPAL